MTIKDKFLKSGKGSQNGWLQIFQMVCLYLFVWPNPDGSPRLRPVYETGLIGGDHLPPLDSSAVRGELRFPTLLQFFEQVPIQCCYFINTHNNFAEEVQGAGSTCCFQNMLKRSTAI